MKLKKQLQIAPSNHGNHSGRLEGTAQNNPRVSAQCWTKSDDPGATTAVPLRTKGTKEHRVTSRLLLAHDVSVPRFNSEVHSYSDFTCHTCMFSIIRSHHA